jgi:hypothetical protein
MVVESYTQLQELNAQAGSVSNHSSLNSSYSVLASWREVWRDVATDTTLIFVTLSRRRMAISSPGLTGCADLAGLRLIETRLNSQSLCADVRRRQRRLLLRKRSSLIPRTAQTGFSELLLNSRSLPKPVLQTCLGLGKDLQELAFLLIG